MMIIDDVITLNIFDGPYEYEEYLIDRVRIIEYSDTLTKVELYKNGTFHKSYVLRGKWHVTIGRCCEKNKVELIKFE